MLEQAEIDQSLNQGILIGDGRAATQMTTLNAEDDSLRVDPFGGGALLEDLFIGITAKIARVLKRGNMSRQQ